MLAVATHNPTSVAETYVRQHMRRIAPGETLGVGLIGEDPKIGIPFHIVERRKGGAFGKLGTLAALARTGYAGALNRDQESKLEKAFNDADVRVVLAEFGTTGCALRSICVRLGLPLIVNFHGHDATVLGRRRDVRYAYRLLAKDAAAIICGSRHFSETLHGLGFPENKVFVVPCGVEMSSFEPNAKKDHSLVAAIGRLTEKKRPDLTIRAFAKASRSHPDLRLEIIGDGPMRSDCEALIAELGVDDLVSLHGAQPHEAVSSLLARASILLQHSVTAANGDQESQGISLLEAMASGMAVVITDHNGFSETVIDGVTGLLSPELDVDAMASNLEALLSDRVLAASMGEAGRARVAEKFDADVTTSMLRGIIRRVMSVSEGSCADAFVGAGGQA